VSVAQQTVNHVVLHCPIHRPHYGVNGLTVLDDQMIAWLLNTYSRDLVWPSSRYELAQTMKKRRQFPLGHTVGLLQLLWTHDAAAAYSICWIVFRCIVLTSRSRVLVSSYFIWIPERKVIKSECFWRVLTNKVMKAFLLPESVWQPQGVKYLVWETAARSSATARETLGSALLQSYFTYFPYIESPASSIKWASTVQNAIGRDVKVP